MHSSRLVARNFLTLGSGEAFARLVAFGATIYVARVLGAADYGVIGLATGIVLYLSRVADGGLELGLGVRETAAEPGAIGDIASSLLIGRTVLGFILVVLTAALSLTLMPRPEGVVLACYALTLLPLAASTRWVYLGFERANAVALARAVGELTMVGLVLLLVRRPGDLARVPLAQVSGDALAATLLLLGLRRLGLRMPVRFDWARVRPIVLRSWPLVLSSMLGLIIYNSDLILLRVFRDRATVGYYAAAYALISFLINLGIAYSLSLLPTLTRLRSEPEQQRELYRTATAQVFAAGLPIAVGGAFLAPHIIGFVFGDAYAPASGALRILLWYMPLSLLRDVPIIALMASARENLVLRVTAWAAALNLALNFLLIPRYGITGAAAATVATEAVRMVIAFGYAHQQGFPWAGIARFWRASIAAGAMAGLLLLTGATALWTALLLGCVTYVGGLLLVGAIRIESGGSLALNL